MFKEILYVGHRGTRTEFDENTIQAYKKAIEFGADYIELDVRKTKDGRLIVLHDTTLERTTTGSGFLKDFTYDEIKNFKTRINNQDIPLLSNVFDQLRGKTKFIIELKEENLKNKVLKLIENYNLLGDSIFSGRNLNYLKDIKENYHQCRICYNITKGMELTLKDFLKLERRKNSDIKIDAICLRSDLIDSKFINLCEKKGILSLAWDFLKYKQPLKRIKSLISLGIDGILFDNHKNIPKIKKWLRFL